VPRIEDYRAAFKLIWMPAMATVLSITVFRIAAASIQDSFYPVFLTSIGYPATQIGILITISSALGAVSALSVGWLTRRIDGLWLLIGSTMGAIVFIAATPLFTAYWMLVIMAALRGVCMGISQPLMLSLLVSAAERKEQGLGVSLRVTANRVAAAVTPMTMGLVAGAVGLASSFLVMGAVLLAGMAVVARSVLRGRGADKS
jgi:predicted MFS family arabinose efflux permease